MAIVFDDQQTNGKIVFDDELSSSENSQSKPSGSLLDQTSNAIKNATGTIGSTAAPYLNSQIGSPQQILQEIPQAVSKGFSKIGTAASEKMGANGVNPYLSAAIGTGISMAPDIAMTSMAPASEELGN